MALPTSYDEAALIAYMQTITKSVADTLKWTSANYAEAINDCLILYGVGSVTGATDITKLRSLAQVAAWRHIVLATVANFDYSSDTGAGGGQVWQKESQIHTQAKLMLERAEKAAVGAGYMLDDEAALLNTERYAIGMSKVVYDDPYTQVA